MTTMVHTPLEEEEEGQAGKKHHASYYAIYRLVNQADLPPPISPKARYRRPVSSHTFLLYLHT